MRTLRAEFGYFLGAVQFLTRLPVPPLNGFAPVWLDRGVKYFPLAGIVVGSLCAGVYLLASALWSGVLPALLAVAAGVALTGAFHEDGFADFFDCMGGQSHEARLAIMKDSRLGTFGVLALGFAMAIKVAALAAIPAHAVAAALIAAHAGGRFATIAVMPMLPYAATHRRPRRNRSPRTSPFQGSPSRLRLRSAACVPAAAGGGRLCLPCRFRGGGVHRVARASAARRIYGRRSRRGRAEFRDRLSADGCGCVRLILVRHPKPRCESGVCYGRLDLDCEPDALEDAARRLSGLVSGARVYTSPLRRARDLAERLDARPVVDARLQELDFGELGGAALAGPRSRRCRCLARWFAGVRGAGWGDAFRHGGALRKLAAKSFRGRDPIWAVTMPARSASSSRS